MSERVQVAFGSDVDLPVGDRWCGQDLTVELVSGQDFQFLTAIQHTTTPSSDARWILLPQQRATSSNIHCSGSPAVETAVGAYDLLIALCGPRQFPCCQRSRPETAGDTLQRIACFCLKCGLSASGLDALGSLFDERGDRPWLRHVDGVAALDLGDRGTRPLRHGTLGHRRDHFILSDN